MMGLGFVLELSFSSLSVVLLTRFLSPEVGPLTLLLALPLCSLVCFLALSLVTVHTLLISLHATLQCSIPAFRYAYGTAP